MIKKKCNHPGCNILVDKGIQFCSKHQSMHGFQPSSWEHLYNNTLWRNTSREYLGVNQVCRICGDRATVVDHIIPHRGNTRLFWDESNWEPLCKTCHDRKTKQEIASRNRRDPY